MSHTLGVTCPVCGAILADSLPCPEGCTLGHGYADASISEWSAKTWPNHGCFRTALNERDAMTADLPYAGTSGWSGTDTSEARAREADESGKTGKRQAEVLELARRHGAYGITVKELREDVGWHHGTASGALSVLHKVGHLERLTERRDRCGVYVLPRYTMGRETQPHGRRQSESLGDTITLSTERYLDLVRKAEAHDRAVEWGLIR